MSLHCFTWKQKWKALLNNWANQTAFWNVLLNTLGDAPQSASVNHQIPWPPHVEDIHCFWGLSGLESFMASAAVFRALSIGLQSLFAYSTPARNDNRVESANWYPGWLWLRKNWAWWVVLMLGPAADWSWAKATMDLVMTWVRKLGCSTVDWFTPLMT